MNVCLLETGKAELVPDGFAVVATVLAVVDWKIFEVWGLERTFTLWFEIPLGFVFFELGWLLIAVLGRMGFVNRFFDGELVSRVRYY